MSARTKPTRRKASRSTRSASRTATRRRRVQFARRGIAVALVLLALVMLVLGVGTCVGNSAKRVMCEEWRGTAQKACEDTGLGAEWTDAILAIVYIESGGNKDVSSVLGVEGDIMQAAEGTYGSIVKNGSDEYGVEAQTPEASIYAGTLEFKQNLDLWQDCLGDIGPDDESAIQLVVQGYNFGADGWVKWCKANGITSYTLADARRYSDEELPDSAKGTPSHGEKWLAAYQTLRAS